MSHHRTNPMAGLCVTGLATLASRFLGMIRDVATAWLFGLAGGGVFDAFVVAFRVPNLFRRLFGEGALSASYLPVLAEWLNGDRSSAWRLVSAVMAWGAAVLGVMVVAIEFLCLMVFWSRADDPRIALTVGLAATMMPYTLLVCLAAQAAATLHALSHFLMPALAPVVLNVCWLAAVWGIAPFFSANRTAQAYLLAVSIVVAGCIQLAIQWLALRRLGFRFQTDWVGTRGALVQVGRGVLPTMFGLAITELNTLVDVLLAWFFSRGGGLLPRGWGLTPGAAAAIYYAERLHEFPQGIVGTAVATVIFPLLSRHAARGDRVGLSEDFAIGLRLVMFLALPASVGMILLSEPIARLLFERGQFTVDDTLRTSRMIACFGVGVWAYCGLPLLVRGFYAIGDLRRPVQIGLAAMGFNLVCGLVLLRPLGERGLALATSLAAAVQFALLTARFSRRTGPLPWWDLIRSGRIAVVSTVVMAAISYAALMGLPYAGRFGGKLSAVCVPLALGMGAYLLVHWLSGGTELRMLLGGRCDTDSATPTAPRDTSNGSEGRTVQKGGPI